MDAILSHTKPISPIPTPCMTFHITLASYSEEMLAPRTTPKLKDHPLSATHDGLLNIFTANLPPLFDLRIHKYSMSEMQSQDLELISTPCSALHDK
jgi:hypothetical protein